MKLGGWEGLGVRSWEKKEFGLHAEDMLGTVQSAAHSFGYEGHYTFQV
jgi:hypothetical protein